MMAATIMENLHGDKIERECCWGGERVTGSIKRQRKGSDEDDWRQRERWR